MKALLVVNADDFGLSEGTNQAILDAHCIGIVTSTSLLANGAAFEHAVALARHTPTLGVGVHLTLTEGPALSGEAARLFGRDGDLPLTNQPFVRALLAGRLPREAIRREFEAQVQRVIGAGLVPTHVDGHKYIHLLPGVTEIAVEVAQWYEIPAMRVPHRMGDRLAWSRMARLPGALVLAGMGTFARRSARRAGMAMSDRLVGFVDTGHLTPAAIRRLLGKPRPGLTELLCHPAYPTPALTGLLARGYRWIGTYDFEGETQAVSSPDLRRMIESTGWTLCHFGTVPG
jgi:predicted glycoside hydrolase/deacetylase ChbG (UPF0249 family)